MRPLELLSLGMVFIIGFFTYFYFEAPHKPVRVPVVEVTPVIPVTPVAVKIPVEKIPEPFRYAEAVIPSFVPTPKPRPRPRHRHFPVCKPMVVK